MIAQEKISNGKLKQIYFYLTQGCNLKCCHCWVMPKHEKNKPQNACLDVNLLQNIIRQAIPLGLTQVKLTGGEPLLHPDISRIIETIQNQGLHLVLETNGVLCTQEIADLLARGKNPHVAVSLDGIDASTHDNLRGVPGSFDATVNGITYLVKNGIRPQVIFSIMRANLHQVDKIILFAEALGASSVKFNIVQPSGRGTRLSANNLLPNVPELVKTGEWVQGDLAQKAAIPLIFDYPVAFRSLRDIFATTQHSNQTCGVRNAIGVLPGGSYALCGIGEIIPELCLGHAEKEPLETVWRQSALLKEIRNGLPHRLKGICGRCLMKSVCLGKCAAQNYVTEKTFWGPYWFCEQARTAGCFPENRLINDKSD